MLIQDNKDNAEIFRKEAASFITKNYSAATLLKIHEHYLHIFSPEIDFQISQKKDGTIKIKKLILVSRAGRYTYR